MNRFFPLALLVLFASGASGEPLQVCSFQGAVRPVAYEYLVFSPRAAAEKPALHPLILLLHGKGERGNDLSRVARLGLLRRAQEQPDFPFLVVAPQCPADRNWDPEALIALLDDVCAKLPVDRRRIYLTGLSMGGYAAWRLAARHPERFAAVAPICGGGDLLDVKLQPPEARAALRRLAVRAFHNDGDPVVALAESQRMVEAFRQAGVGEIELHVAARAKHNAWSAAYADPSLYDWFLAHQLPAAAPKPSTP